MKQIFTLLALVLTIPVLKGQTIVGVSPSSGAKGQTLNVTITGTNTNFTSGSATVMFFGQATSIVANTVTPVNATMLNASITIPPGTPSGSYSVTTFDMADGYLIKSNAFTVTGPKLLSVNPASGFKGQTLNVTITGQTTHFTQGSPMVSFFRAGSPVTNLVLNNTTVNNDSSIVANITLQSTAQTGPYNVSVYEPADGLMVLYNSFLVQGPNVSVSPFLVERNRTFRIAILGSGTHFTQGTGTTVSFLPGSQITLNATNVVSDLYMTADITIPQTAPVGSVQVQVSNATDGIILSNIYVNNPTFSSLFPNTGARGATMDITLNGKGTSFTQSPRVVKFYYMGTPSGVIVNSFTPVNDSVATINATIPVNTGPGSYQIRYTSPLDGTVNGNNFSITNPVSSISVSPSTSVQGETLNITITGQNTYFAQSTPTFVSFFRGVSPTSDIVLDQITVVDDQTITASAVVKPWAIGLYEMYVSDPFYNLMQDSAMKVGVVGLPEEKTARSLKVWPNPSAGMVNIEMETQSSSVVQLEVVNLLGEKVYARQYDPLYRGKNTWIVNKEDAGLRPGLYLIRLTQDQNTYLSKVKIQ